MILPIEDKTPRWIKALVSLVIMILIFNELALVLGAVEQSNPPSGDLNMVAYEYEDGTYSGSGPVATIAQHDKNVYSGIIFPDVVIPANASVSNATLTLHYWNGLNYAETPTNILIEAIPGDPSVIYPGLLRTPATTTASYYTYDISGWDAEGNFTLVITDIVKELQEGYTWNETANNILIRIVALAPTGPGSSPDYYRYEISTNLGPANEIPLLNITYDASTSEDIFYKGYTITPHPNGTYTGTQYVVEVGDATWRVTGAINEHWLISTDNDVFILVYDDGGDDVSYYISDWGDLSDWDDPTEHGETVYIGDAFSERPAVSAWYHEVEDIVWLSGGYQSIGNNYVRHTNTTFDSTLGYASLWNSQIGSHGGNTIRSTCVVETPAGYRAVGYGSGSTVSYKYYTSPTDAVYTTYGGTLATDASAEVIVSYFGGLESKIGMFMAYEDELDDYDLRFRTVNMSDNSGVSGLVYMGYIDRYTYALSPGALNDDQCYLTYYNTSSGWLESWAISVDGTYTKSMIDELTPVGTVSVSSILDTMYNDTRIVAYVYDDSVNSIYAYNFYNGTWDGTPKLVTTIGYTITSLMATPKGNVNVSGLLAEHSTGLIYIDVSEAFTGGFGGFTVTTPPGYTPPDPDCLASAETLADVEACIDTVLDDDPENPGAGDFEGDEPWYVSRKGFKLYFLLLGIFFIGFPWILFASDRDPKWIGYILFFNTMGLGLLWAMVSM